MERQRAGAGRRGGVGGGNTHPRVPRHAVHAQLPVLTRRPLLPGHSLRSLRAGRAARALLARRPVLPVHAQLPRAACRARRPGDPRDAVRSLRAGRAGRADRAHGSHGAVHAVGAVEAPRAGRAHLPGRAHRPDNRPAREARRSLHSRPARRPCEARCAVQSGRPGEPNGSSPPRLACGMQGPGVSERSELGRGIARTTPATHLAGPLGRRGPWGPGGRRDRRAPGHRAARAGLADR